MQARSMGDAPKLTRRQGPHNQMEGSTLIGSSLADPMQGPITFPARALT